MALTTYHLAWLEAHPSRDAAWLQVKLSEGFDVHHIDGDKANEAPDNLVLIEHEDHMRLHGMANAGRLRRLVVVSTAGRPKGRTEASLANGKAAYGMRSYGMKWREIARRLGLTRGRVLQLARTHAQDNRLSWPLRL